MAVEWLDVRSTNAAPKQDVRVSLSAKGDAINIAFRRGAWMTKLRRADRLAVGFESFNGVPTAMYFSISSAGYRMFNSDGNKNPLIRIQCRKIQLAYPRLKLSELQGDYVLREDKDQNIYYISLGAKSY